jgi:adenylate cyclase
MADTRAIADWLIDGARSAPRPDFVLEQLCDRLVAAGIPLSRVAVFVRTLHPDIIGRRFIWQPGTPVVVSSALSLSMTKTNS